MTAPPTTEIRRADPQARRRAIVWVTAIAAAAAGAIFIVRQAFHDAAVQSAGDARVAVERLSTTLIPVLFLLTLAGAALAGWLARLSWRVSRERCFPPAATPVVRDTKVVHGQRAQQIARIGFAMSALILLTSITLPLLIWSILQTLRYG